jgi:glycosyltransferase involved in cell wall biosynthesis
MIYFYIPVRNEQGTAGVMLYRLMESMRAVDMEYEVHLTLDGCTDDSAEVVEPYLKKLPLTVTHNQSRLGYGKCLYEAIRKASAASQNPKRDFFVILDADFSVDPAEIKEMAPGIERNVVLYLPDRLSPAKNGIGLIKRIANKLADKLLRRRGAKFPENIDLLSTVRACRIQHLRRNMSRVDALGALPANTPPAVSGAMLYMSLHDNSKKTEVLEMREQRMTRRKSRFSLFGVLRNLMFSSLVEKAIFEPERERDNRGRGRSRSSRSRRPDRRGDRGESKGKGDEQRSGTGRSRGGRSRRGRRSGGARAGQAASQSTQQQQQQSAKQKDSKQDGRKEVKQQGADKQSGEKGQAENVKGTGSASTRSRRRRRRPNKRSQDSSNKPQDNKSAE